jgi:hypothetical protein
MPNYKVVFKIVEKQTRTSTFEDFINKDAVRNEIDRINANKSDGFTLGGLILESKSTPSKDDCDSEIELISIEEI